MILSLDCSTTCIGWSVFEKDNLIKYGRIIPTEKGLEWRDRVYNLLSQLESLILEYNPTQIYQEDVPMGGSGGNLTLFVSRTICGTSPVLGTFLIHTERIP